MTLILSETENRFSWKEVAYTLVPLVHPQMGITAIAGKACGIRSDDLSMFAMYDLPWVYPEHFDWTVEARNRLDTFLDCACSTVAGLCSYHQFMTGEWRKQDELRNNLAAHEIPAALMGHVGYRDRSAKVLEM